MYDAILAGVVVGSTSEFPGNFACEYAKLPSEVIMRSTEELVTNTLCGIEQRLNYSNFTVEDVFGLLATSAAMFGLMISPQPIDKLVLYVRCNASRRAIQEARFFDITYTIQQELLDIVDVTEALLTEACRNPEALRQWREILRRLFKASSDLYQQEVTDVAAM